MKEMKNRKNLKRNIIFAAVLVFVCAAAWLNWSYNKRMGGADSAMANTEDEMTTEAENNYEASQLEGEDIETEENVSDYFAEARLTRQQSRDEALALLETAACAEGASQEVIDSAMNAITTMATWSLLESQIENELLAKDFADCVVYLTEDGCTIAVPAPVEGLSEAAVARVTEAVLSNTEYDATQITVIPVQPY